MRGEGTTRNSWEGKVHVEFFMLHVRLQNNVLLQNRLSYFLLDNLYLSKKTVLWCEVHYVYAVMNQNKSKFYQITN